MTPAKRKHVKKVLNGAANIIDALMVALRDEGLLESNPELAALADEARFHRDACYRAARN
jgi:hypothetical protein